MQFDLETLGIRIPVILFAISIHECAHAWVADRCGDPTARLLGRVTLNPLAHLDPIGTLCMILVRFGWGKPVPVNPYNLRNPRRDDMLVSAAGPVSNLLMALGCGIVFRVFWVVYGGDLPTKQGAVMLWFLWKLSIEGIFVACALGLFNLIPVFPLDGSHILKGLLPADLAAKYEAMNPIAPIILLIIVFSPVGSYILLKPLRLLVSFFAGVPF